MDWHESVGPGCGSTEASRLKNSDLWMMNSSSKSVSCVERTLIFHAGSNSAAYPSERDSRAVCDQISRIKNKWTVYTCFTMKMSVKTMSEKASRTLRRSALLLE